MLIIMKEFNEDYRIVVLAKKSNEDYVLAWLGHKSYLDNISSSILARMCTYAEEVVDVADSNIFKKVFRGDLKQLKDSIILEAYGGFVNPANELLQHIALIRVNVPWNEIDAVFGDSMSSTITDEFKRKFEDSEDFMEFLKHAKTKYLRWCNI